MENRRKRVVFANKKLEADFNRVATSDHPEDKKLYSILSEARNRLQTEHQTGRKIPSEEMPQVYKDMFGIDNLWELKVENYGIVLYSVVCDEILIVDIV